MKTSTTFAATLFALASFPLLAQQPPPMDRPDNPAAAQQNFPGSPGAPGAQVPSQNHPAAVPEATAVPQASAVEMSPVNCALVSKLNSKTAKTGDSVVVQTEASVKTADGTVIPKGSKLVGRVAGVQPSGAGENSQVALQFDHIELNGGQSVPVQSQIQSIAPARGAASTSGSAAMGGGAPAGGSSNPNAGGANAANRASSAPEGMGRDSGPAPAGDSGPAAGTIVARSGNIAIRTTSIPGVLVANNAPGQQDPRMAQISSILLGAKQDIQLEGGTQMVLGISAANGGTK